LYSPFPVHTVIKMHGEHNVKIIYKQFSALPYVNLMTLCSKIITRKRAIFISMFLSYFVSTDAAILKPKYVAKVKKSNLFTSKVVLTESTNYSWREIC
jgi:hypothetical protein